ncbi:MAG: aminotransferase class IV [Legionellaceae bacterium]|nr:aminotransferase class IV [Legionellaceae bacterium]
MAGMNWYFSSIHSCVVLPSSSRLLLGEGLFETMRFAGSTVFASYLHWQRMKMSAQDFAIPFALSFSDWQVALRKAVEASALASGGLRLVLMNGAAERGLQQQALQSDALLQTFPHTAATKPVRLIAAPWQRDARNPVYQHKSINYLEAIMAQRYALAQQADDCLFLNMDGEATETGTANIFAFIDQCLCTPSLASGVLPGVARRLILDGARQAGLAVAERPLGMADLQGAEMLFISNALQYIRPVAVVEGRPLPLTHPGLARLSLALDAAEPFTHYAEEQHT